MMKRYMITLLILNIGVSALLLLGCESKLDLHSIDNIQCTPTPEQLGAGI